MISIFHIDIIVGVFFCVFLAEESLAFTLKLTDVEDIGC